MSTPRTTLHAAHYRSGEQVEFVFEGDALVERSPFDGETDMLFGPGFFDLQCNGYAGVDFNSAGITPEPASRAIRAMWAQGCTHVLPTVITNTPERMLHSLEVLAAVRSDAEFAGSIPGFHVEGPFISPEDGARGAHPLHSVVPVSVRLWDQMQRAAAGGIRLLTVAPEVKGALPFIQQLRREHVLPAIGHTLALAETVRQAARAGAMMSTHLGNGCPQMLHRHENPIYAQLGCDELAAGFITDGIHVPAEVVRSMARAKGSSRSIVVTDAMAAAGAPAGTYTINDMEVQVGRDRVVRQPGSPNFAGSALTMDCAVAGYVQMAGVSLAEAWDAASVLPWRLMQEAGPSLAGSENSGLVVLRRGKAGLEIQASMLSSRLLWSAERAA